MRVLCIIVIVLLSKSMFAYSYFHASSRYHVIPITFHCLLSFCREGTFAGGGGQHDWYLAGRRFSPTWKKHLLTRYPFQSMHIWMFGEAARNARTTQSTKDIICQFIEIRRTQHNSIQHYDMIIMFIIS